MKKTYFFKLMLYFLICHAYVAYSQCEQKCPTIPYSVTELLTHRTAQMDHQCIAANYVIIDYVTLYNGYIYLTFKFPAELESCIVTQIGYYDLCGSCNAPENARFDYNGLATQVEIINKPTVRLAVRAQDLKEGHEYTFIATCILKFKNKTGTPPKCINHLNNSMDAEGARILILWSESTLKIAYQTKKSSSTDDFTESDKNKPISSDPKGGPGGGGPGGGGPGGGGPGGGSPAGGGPGGPTGSPPGSPPGGPFGSNCSLPGQPNNEPPKDPNEIIGNTGIDTARWVSYKDTLAYRINFENDSLLANIAAQRIVIRQKLDTTVNPLSIRMGEFGFANQRFTPPTKGSSFTTRLNLGKTLGVDVEVTAGLDIAAREVFWTFQSLEVGKNVPPYDPLKGLLPVNDALGNGEGFVNYTILPRSSSKTRDSVQAQAGIYFDVNAPVITNTWVNRIDAVAPKTKVNTLPVSIDSTTIHLSWTGNDDALGSGMDSYDLYVSDNGAPYTFVLSTTSTSTVYTGTQGHTYSFYTLGIDRVKNREGVKTVADATITIKGDLYLSSKAFLQGAYNTTTGLMTDDLRARRIIPLTEPYTGLTGFSHIGGGGGEATTSTVLSVTGANAIVDWVFVELRSATDPSVVVATRAALIQRDGDIVETDGISPVKFSSMSATTYYVSVMHRNHLGARTATTKDLTIKGLTIDFTNNLSEVLATPSGSTYNALATFSTGVYGLWGGNANGDKAVKMTGFAPSNNDYLKLLNTLGNSTTTQNNVYSVQDLNMDGIVKMTGFSAANNDYLKLLNILVSSLNSIIQPY